MTGISTLLVPAEIYDEALTFCNDRRAEKGLQPVAVLPPGMGDNASACPCSKSCEGLWVQCDYWAWFNFEAEDRYRLPPVKSRKKRGHPTRFTNFFDSEARFGVLTLPVRMKPTP